MTIIEFFDGIPIHNALSTLFLEPKHVILFGSDAKKMQAFSANLTKVIDAQGLSTRVEVVHVKDKSYASLLQALERLVLKYPDCAFDLTGGDTEVLVAMGALSQKYGTPMHTIDPIRGIVTPFTQTEVYSAPVSPQLSIRENILLFGGNISESYVPTTENDAFWSDVLMVWSVCRTNCASWNTAISILHTFCTPETDFPYIPLDLLSKKVSSTKKNMLLHILRMLQKRGCLVQYEETAHGISFRYKNRAVQTALSKEGTALELFTFYAAHIFPKQGKKQFTDGAIGVVINWDTAVASAVTDDIKNEIDVFLMKKLTPVFISCKNGYVNTDELYKLSIVAARFGGPYAKKAIVLSRHKPDVSFMGRAKELNIRVFFDVQNLSPSAFSALIQKNL